MWYEVLKGWHKVNTKFVTTTANINNKIQVLHINIITVHSWGDDLGNKEVKTKAQVIFVQKLPVSAQPMSVILSLACGLTLKHQAGSKSNTYWIFNIFNIYLNKYFQ